MNILRDLGQLLPGYLLPGKNIHGGSGRFRAQNAKRALKKKKKSP